MDPFTDNAAIGYARLNVPQGQRKMYESPWTRDSVRTTPWIDNRHFVDPKQGVSVLRGVWDEEANALILSVRGWDFEGRACPESVVIKPVGRGPSKGIWAAYVRGKLAEAKKLNGKHGEGFEVSATIARGEEVDVVFWKSPGGANGYVSSRMRIRPPPPFKEERGGGDFGGANKGWL
ncbi:uncharacterized protein Z518_08996 [Rhinocladiella mackenziei CBS 650.93]|uniref:Rhinocladiella mackenziei CBS 650.93 unplaced genomic scaffold supercont1.7, whole genome shotgun sequence n=1 Tax=Rhinocladiella mackenziei CBS 650.93 TaxID=1442369 RepID=A0A0D2IDF8_9EURO|nr:uncharacterized protein Z518_08996 [Rhinocladiella mackenziei CBS 650.93]KIX01271.1 hypothetical protein Z518_08996 [Rhinocladiella mackenziei CBS 650.93]